MFWLGFIIGVFAGGAVGIVIASLCKIAPIDE